MVTLSEREPSPVHVPRAAVQMVRISQEPAVNNGGQVGGMVGRFPPCPPPQTAGENNWYFLMFTIWFSVTHSRVTNVGVCVFIYIMRKGSACVESEFSGLLTGANKPPLPSLIGTRELLSCSCLHIKPF